MASLRMLFALGLVVSLAGCYDAHGLGPDPSPDPHPHPPCSPATCYAVSEPGCLDLDDSYLPDACPSRCIAGYAELGAYPVCETPVPPPMCSVPFARVGFDTSPPPASTVIDVVVEGEAARVILAMPDDGSFTFSAPRAHLDTLRPGDLVRCALEPRGGVVLHRLEGPEVAIVALSDGSGLPLGVELEGAVIAIGPVVCPASTACGTAESHALEVARAGVTRMLAPGEGSFFPSPEPEGAPLRVTHTGADRYDGDGSCEVFVPWNVSLVVSTPLTFPLERE